MYIVKSKMCEVIILSNMIVKFFKIARFIIAFIRNLLVHKPKIEITIRIL